MRWTVNKDQADYMRLWQEQNRQSIGKIEAEEWAWRSIKLTGLRWKRQSIWGCRIFDFWCHEKGVAIEIDGSSHDPEYDSARDQYNLARSAIIVFRVRNFDETGLKLAVSGVLSLSSWEYRRDQAGLNAHSKAERRATVKALGIKLAHGNWNPVHSGRSII